MHWVFEKLPRRLKQFFGRRKGLQEITSNTGWVIGGRVVRMLVGLGIMAMLADYLGPRQYGTYSYALALIALLSYLSDLGLRGIVVRGLVEGNSKSEILGATFALRFAAGIASAGAALAIVWLLRPDDTVTRIIVAIVSSQLLFRAVDVIDLWFQAQVRSKYSVCAKVFGLAIGAAAKVVLVVLEAPLTAFAWCAAGEAFCGATGLLLVYHFRGESAFRWKATLPQARDLLFKSWPLIISGFSAIVYLKVDILMLGEIVGDTEAGIYAVAARLSETWYFIPTAVAGSAFPALLKSKERSETLYQKQLQNLYEVLFVAAVAVAVPITFAAGPIVEFVFGSDYRAAGLILAVHIWASIFVFMRAALSKWLIAEDLYIFSMVTHVAGAAVNVGVNLLIIPRMGSLGAAIATIVSYAVASYFSLFLSKKTKPAADMMSLAMVSPLRRAVRMARLMFPSR